MLHEIHIIMRTKLTLNDEAECREFLGTPSLRDPVRPFTVLNDKQLSRFRACGKKRTSL